MKYKKIELDEDEGSSIEVVVVVVELIELYQNEQQQHVCGDVGEIVVVG